MNVPSFDWLMLQANSAAQEFYADNGFVIFDKIFDDDLCNTVDRIYRKDADADFAPILNLDREIYYIRNNVMQHQTVVYIIEELTQSTMVGCQTFFLFKEPGTRFAAQAFNPHQDNSYPRTVPGAYLAVDVSLCDQDKASGGICVWPGTHKLLLLPFEEKTGYREKEGEQPGNRVILPRDVILNDAPDLYCGDGLNPTFPPTARVYDKVDITLKKGDAMIFDGDLIHASYPNNSDKPRPAVITNYLRADAEMIEGRTAKRMKIPLT
jgi:ectoine hydroxylase-related dioxygenase (phytanoyl-CoA dioxygenase family)